MLFWGLDEEDEVGTVGAPVLVDGGGGAAERAGMGCGSKDWVAQFGKAGPTGAAGVSFEFLWKVHS